MSTESASNRPRLGDTAILLALCLPFALSSLVLPWGRDQGIYGQAAARLLDGFVPYSQTFVFKPPGTLAVHAIGTALFGPHMLSIRLLDIGWTLATAMLLAAIARRATGDRIAGIVAGVAYAAIYHQQGYWMSAQTDGWANLPVAAGLVLLLADRGGRGVLVRAALAGLLASAAFWLKYTTGGVLVVFALVPLLQRGRAGLLPSGMVFVGFGLGLGAVLALLAAVGALDQFLSIQAEVVLPYTGATGSGLGRRDLLAFFLPFGRFTPPGLILGALGLVMVVVDVVRRRGVDRSDVAGLAAVGWVLAGVLSAFVQGKFWTYQYLLVLGGLAVLVAIGVSVGGRWIGRRWTHRVVALTLIVVACFIFPWRWYSLGRMAVGSTTLSQVYLDGQFGSKRYGLDEIVAVGDWLRARTPPDEPIYVWAYDPVIYVLAERDMVSRFPYTYPMVVGWGPRDAYRAELVAALQTTPPSAIVVGSRDGVRQVMGHRKDSWKTLNEFPELSEFLRSNYRQVERIGRFRIFRRTP